MRDSRDYTILALAGALLFCLGLLVGRDATLLPAASAQDEEGQGNTQGESPDSVDGVPPGAIPTPGDVFGSDDPSMRSHFGGPSSSAATASDSNSNNRFVAVTTPIGSGESVVFVLDSHSEQLCVYRYLRGKGLQLVAGRKIDYDLRMSAYKDFSEYTRDEMQSLFERQMAKRAAKSRGD